MADDTSTTSTSTKTYNYEPAYPLDTSSSSTETHLSAFQKIKMEFERIYRVINAEFSSWAGTLDGWTDQYEAFKEEIQAQIDAFDTKFDSLEDELTNSINEVLDEYKSKLETFESKLKTATGALDYDNAVSVTTAEYFWNYTTWTYTVPFDGYIYANGSSSGGYASGTVNGDAMRSRPEVTFHDEYIVSIEVGEYEATDSSGKGSSTYPYHHWNIKGLVSKGDVIVVSSAISSQYNGCGTLHYVLYPFVS